MGIREKIARLIAPQMKGEAEIRAMVKDEVARARAALPIVANYDPKNEGYRRLSGTGQQQRELSPTTQDRMFEIAYWMFDSSAMFRGMLLMDQSFLFGEPITVTSDDEAVEDVLKSFMEDTENNMAVDFPEHMLWLSALGEQCWPVDINPVNGHVRLGYADPAQIKEVYLARHNIKVPVQVEMMGTAGRSGKKYAVIREDHDPRSPTYGKLVGECFFWAINKPPNASRGRSDFLTLFDWIDGLERYGFNYLERAEFLLNFVWDVTLNGMTSEQIQAWMRDNPPPEPGSLRAHNEQVTWSAVAPDIKAQDHTKGFNMGKAFIMGAARRPEAWFGGGGKAYQTEAEQFGQVPIKDLDRRQLYYKHILTRVLQFAVDQAVIHGRLTEKQAEAGFMVNLPEISKKDLAKLSHGVPALTTALTLAEDQGWIRHETAARLFCIVCGQLGLEVDVDAEMDAAEAGAEPEEDEGLVTEDYQGR